MEYVIRDQKEKPKETEVWLEELSFSKIVFRVGRFSVFSFYPDGTGYLNTGIPKDNEEGIKVDESGRIKLVE